MSVSKNAPPERKTNPVKVKLCYHKKKKIFDAPKPITLILANKEEVFWTCESARLEITTVLSAPCASASAGNNTPHTPARSNRLTVTVGLFRAIATSSTFSYAPTAVVNRCEQRLPNHPTYQSGKADRGPWRRLCTFAHR